MERVGLVVTLALLALVAAAPAPESSPGPAPHPHPADEDVVYDQRQNGTDNVRVQLSGLTVVLAPVEALFGLDFPADLTTPARSASPDHKSNAQKSKLINVLLGFLGNNHNE